MQYNTYTCTPTSTGCGYCTSRKIHTRTRNKILKFYTPLLQSTQRTTQGHQHSNQHLIRGDHRQVEEWNPALIGFRTLVTDHIQSLCIASGAPWYFSYGQIHEDLRVSFFVYHIRGLTETFDSKLNHAGNPLVGNSADICSDRGSTRHLKRQPRVRKVRKPRLSVKRPPGRLIESRPAATFRLPWLIFL
jgi:hypothetical protein